MLLYQTHHRLLLSLRLVVWCERVMQHVALVSMRFLRALLQSLNHALARGLVFWREKVGDW